MKSTAKTIKRADPRDTGTVAAKPAQTHNPNAPADAQSAAPSAVTEQPRTRKKLEPDLVSVTVHTAFILTRDSGEQVKYSQGTQDIPVEDADHWYAKHHLDRNE